MENEYLIIFVTFLCVFVFVLWCFASDKKKDEDRLPLFISVIMPMADVYATDLGMWLEHILPVFSAKMTHRCREANLSWRASTLYGLQFTMALIVFVIGCVVTFTLRLPAQHIALLLFLMCVCGFMYPFLYVKRRAETRMLEISRVMPFAIDMICSSMSAGADFISAVRYFTSLDMKDAVSREFNIFLREVELGKARSDALRNMGQRLYSAEMDRFIGSIIFGLEAGTPIIDVMQLQADEVRRVRFSNIEQQIAKVPSKMIIPIMLCIVPAMFIMVLVPLFMSVDGLGIFDALKRTRF